MSVTPTVNGMEALCPKPTLDGLSVADEYHLEWLQRQPKTNAVADHQARINTAADPAVMAVFARLQEQRERASEQDFVAAIPKRCSKERRDICPKPMKLIISTPTGPEIWWKRCENRRCPACGERWANDRRADAEAAIPDRWTLFVTEVNKGREWDRVRTYIRRHDGSAATVPLPDGRRLVVTDRPLDGAEALDRDTALDRLDHERSQVPERLRTGELPKGSQVSWLGEWRESVLERRAETPTEGLPEGYAVDDIITADVDLVDITADIEAAGGTLVPITADPDSVTRWKPRGLDIDRWLWLKRKWRCRSLESLVAAHIEWHANNDHKHRTDRLRADARARRTAA